MSKYEYKEIQFLDFVHTVLVFMFYEVNNQIQINMRLILRLQ